jgi:hypothetical protein
VAFGAPSSVVVRDDIQADCKRIFGLFSGARVAPGHDEIRASRSQSLFNGLEGQRCYRLSAHRSDLFRHHVDHWQRQIVSLGFS